MSGVAGRHGRLIWLALALFAAGCGREPAMVEPLEVTAGFDSETELGRADDTAPIRGKDSIAKDGSRPGGGSVGSGGGIWVVDAAGDPVGVLVQRGHPHQGQANGVDPLRDGVLVYAPAADLFFGVEMVSGKVLVPRLGVADGACNIPLVAGYYTAGEDVAGMRYGFAWRGLWYRIVDGAPLKLVSCAGVTKQGAEPLCVLHSGSCRGFPVSKVAVSLAQSFAGPLTFKWVGAVP